MSESVCTPSPPDKVEDYQLKGGARNDEEPVKHAPQTHRSRRAAAGGATGPRGSLLPLLRPCSPRRFSVDGFCGEARPGEPPGEKRPLSLHRQQHAVCVRRLPGERALPAQVCAANATASIHGLSQVLLQNDLNNCRVMFLFLCTVLN